MSVEARARRPRSSSVPCPRATSAIRSRKPGSVCSSIQIGPSASSIRRFGEPTPSRFRNQVSPGASSSRWVATNPRMPSCKVSSAPQETSSRRRSATGCLRTISASASRAATPERLSLAPGTVGLRQMSAAAATPSEPSRAVRSAGAGARSRSSRSPRAAPPGPATIAAAAVSVSPSAVGAAGAGPSSGSGRRSARSVGRRGVRGRPACEERADFPRGRRRWPCCAAGAPSGAAGAGRSGPRRRSPPRLPPRRPRPGAGARRPRAGLPARPALRAS